MNDTPTLTRAERNRQQLRTDIIQAAFAEFAERGYHQTAIADIAQRLGIGHGTFYRYFQNKRDILDHVIDDVTSRILAILADENAPEAVSNLDDYRAQCRRIAERLATILSTNPQMLRLVLFEATSIDRQMTDRLLDLLDLGGKLVSGYMANGQRLGFFRPDLDVDATGQAVVGMILAGALRYLRHPDDSDGQQRLMEAIQRLLVDGIAFHGT